MRSTNRTISIATSVLAAVLLVSLLPDTARSQGRLTPARRALDSFLKSPRNLAGVRADLYPLSQQRYQVRPDSEELVLFKILNRQNRNVFVKVWDPRTPNDLFDIDHLRGLEMQRLSEDFDQYGWMSRQLAESLKERRRDAWQAALFRMRVAEEQLDKIDDLQGRTLADLAADAIASRTIVEAEARALFKQTLSSYKAKRRIIGVFGPFVAARVCVKDLRNPGLRKHPNFVSIGSYAERTVFDSVRLKDSLPATLVDRVQASGLTGRGVRIGLIESGGLALPRDRFRNLKILDDDEGASLHMTLCAAMIAHRASGGPAGYAPNAHVIVSNKKGDYVERYRHLAREDLPTSIVSMSWHETSEESDDSFPPRDDFFDFAATTYPWPTVFTSAGNGAVDDNFAAGRGFNILSVGDVRNDGDHFRSNDKISIMSSWRNPRVGDREIPSIAAPGSRHRLLGHDFGGTSAATPVAAAIGALVMEANPALKPWPEAIRAILQATSDYEGADDFRWSRTFDDRDGTGMLNAQAAVDVAKQPYQPGGSPQARVYGRLDADAFTESVRYSNPPSPPCPFDPPPTRSGWLAKTWTITEPPTPAAGFPSRVRVALAWNGRTVFSTTVSPWHRPSSLDADLDLHVYKVSDPTTPIASSSTRDNSYEAVEFVATPGETYTIQVYGQNVAEDFNSYFGLAWMRSMP